MTQPEAQAIYDNPAGNDIRTQCEAIATLIGATFYYGRRYDNNINADNCVFPAIFMIEPDELGFEMDDSIGTVYDYDNVFLQFLTIYNTGDTDRMEMAQQAAYRYEPVKQMRALAKRFTHLAKNGNGLALQATQGRVRANGRLLVDYMDVAACGIEINLPMRNAFPDIECYE